MRKAMMGEEMRRHYDELATQEIDVAKIATKFGVDLRGKDVPKQIKLVKLYTRVPVSRRVFSKVFSVALGMRWSLTDVKHGRVNRLWENLERPELSGNLLLVGRAPPELLEDTDDVTCFAKFHLKVPLLGSPSLIIAPIQKAMLKRTNDPEVMRELEEGLSNARPSRKHAINWKKLTLVKTHSGDVFDHRDRHLALALVALELAERLGVSKIVLPSKHDIRAWEATLRFKRDAEMMPRGSGAHVKELYEDVKKLLEQAAGKCGFQVIQRRWW